MSIHHKQRPINLNLFTFSFPLPAIVSILHRISGVLLILLFPISLILLSLSLASPASFETVHTFLTTPLVKCAVWASLVSLFYHLCAGVRHLLMDIHIGDSLSGGRLGSWCVIAATALLALGTGVWLW